MAQTQADTACSWGLHPEAVHTCGQGTDAAGTGSLEGEAPARGAEAMAPGDAHC